MHVVQDIAPELRAWIDAEIKEEHRAIMVVSDVMPHAFTISSKRWSAPELVMFGTDGPNVRAVLHAISRMLPRMKVKDAPAVIPLKLQAGKFGVKLRRVRPAEAIDAWPTMAPMRDYHGALPDLCYQVLLPDANGRFTGEAGVGPEHARIPLLKAA